MNYNNYITYLKKNNIILFDYQYRLSYYKLNKLQLFNNQIGGSINNKNNTNILFKNKSYKETINIINLSLSNNIKLGYLYYLIYN